MSYPDDNPVSALIAGLVAGGVETVDLTHPLSESSPVASLPLPFTNPSALSRAVVRGYEDDPQGGLEYALTFGEHTGTHLVAPAHWITGRSGSDVASIPLSVLIGPACVIDRTVETETDPGYLLTVDDLEAWENQHGEMPPRAWVLFRTGWADRIADEAAFLNIGSETPVTPGPDVEASRWLAHQRPISGFGVETVSLDAGAASGFDPPYPLQRYLLGANRCGLTQLANLRRLPVTGAMIVVAPLRLAGGTGSPARVVAFVESG